MCQTEEKVRECIESGRAVLGIELGSTRIKTVLIDENHTPVASGSHEWENRLEGGFWTYSLEDVWTGLKAGYRNMAAEVREKYGVSVKKLGAVGFSAMMHGYLAFDSRDKLLVPFRTWRNSTTADAAEALTGLFQYNIPQRWSIAHLYQAILNGEEHVKDIAYITTLAGYVHWKLTGKKVLGIGDASGMFPIDAGTKAYDAEMIRKFDDLTEKYHFPWKLAEILPEILTAGEEAGVLTEEGAGLLDDSGLLQAGIPVCPPEGDAGTGMAATDSVAPGTGNVSAGTSVFAMVVLEKGLSRVHPEIDLVTTPDGKTVGMVHANNCTSDLNAWVKLFKEVVGCFGIQPDPDRLYRTLYEKALEGDKECGGLLSYGYLSGENITGIEEGRPLFVRTPNSAFTLANFMRVHLYSALAALKVGMDILAEEGVHISRILGHGGFFKTPGVGQRILSAAINAPVSVMETAGEGGAWGMALLASYMKEKEENGSLEEYLSKKVFAGCEGTETVPDESDVNGFAVFMKRYKKGLDMEQAAVDYLED